MSSLLDVLHKRPPRSQVTVPEPEREPETSPPAAQVSPDAPAVELRLAPEQEAAEPTLTPTLTMRRPALPASDEPASDDQMLPTPAPIADTTQARRWTDSVPAEPAPAQPVPAAAAPAVRQPRRSRAPALIALMVAVAMALGFVAYRFTGTSEESFLAVPGQAMPPPAQPADAQGAAPAEPAAADVAKPAKKKRRAAAMDENSDAGGKSAAGDLAWYDQPALPAGAANATNAPVIQITHGSTRNPLFEKLRDAYAALQSGDAARAESLYREALVADPNSVDALLGLATLAARGGRYDEARDLYRRVQRLDPKNGTATAALSALPGIGVQAATESQLKGMLREQPASSALHFALGLRYVADQRWPDAQAAFFEAVRHDPTNADYAFNLAVSLDRLGQAQAAASYYQRAIDLASGSQQFAVETARTRLATLRGPQG